MTGPPPEISTADWSDWRWQVKNRLTTPGQLASFLKIMDLPQNLRRVLDLYPWGSTPYYLSLVDRDAQSDPIALQCIPREEEITFSLPGSDPDPLAERANSPCPGLLHRYRDRVLVLATGTCYSYCRHCNRKRNWKTPDLTLSETDIQRMVRYISAHPEIREVIISGGDPLTLPLETLDRMLHCFRAIHNVEVLRLGTRVPVVLPMRITNELALMLKGHRPLWVNTHFNHAREITTEAADACDRLLCAGIPVSNHTVLLRGVNDSYEVLHRLFTRLNRIMVRPYYLFHCDAVKGTDHFRTSIDTGVRLMLKLWGDTGGLCLPRYVVDLPSGGGKAPVMPSFLIDSDKDCAIFRTSEGGVLKYRGPHGAEARHGR